MQIKKGGVYLANLDPQFGTERGKVRPVVVVQTDLLNGVHPSTVICPLTSRVQPKARLLRVHVTAPESGLLQPSDVLVDQVRAIDNRRLVRPLGRLSPRGLRRLMENLRVILT